MDMHLRVWSLNYRHPSRAEAYAETLLAMALQEPVRPQWPLPGGVADFAIPTAGIILEIDDKSHKAKRDKDEAKRNKWRDAGWFVMACDDSPDDIVRAVGVIKRLIDKLPAIEATYDGSPLGSRVVLRGDYYKGMAAKRAAKKLKANTPKASKPPKASSKVSRKRSPAAKPVLG